MHDSPEKSAKTSVVLIVLIAILIISGLLARRFLVQPQPSNRDVATSADQSLLPGLPSPDPRLTYQGPFKNIHPDVAYVSDEKCVNCHPNQSKTYREHPMALTLRLAAQSRSPPIDLKANNPFDAFGQQLQVVLREGQPRHVRTFVDDRKTQVFRQEMEVHYVAGSGEHAHSYLTIRDASVVQTPITWFSQKNRWDLSPGFNLHLFSGRRVGADCLFCHSNGANEDPEEELRVRQPVFPNGHGIGCQRCHGPGSEHIKDPGLVKTTGGLLDPTIVNPARLSPFLRESVCWQCHLEGEVRVQRRGRQRYDFRPGLPLDSMIAVFDDPASATYDHVVNHVEQMLMSQCYQKSAGSRQMGCVSCHDPHEKPAPAQRIAYYRNACLSCHKETACSLPKPERLSHTKEDSCMSCHMPSFNTSNVQHVSSTDHRVVRKVALRTASTGEKKGPVAELVSIFEQQRNANDPEVARDRALASGFLARRGRPMAAPLNREFEEAIKRDPGDVPVKIQYALRLLDRNEAAQALPLLEDALRRQPQSEDGLFGLACAYSKLGRNEESLAAWQRLIKSSPAQYGYRVGYLELLVQENMWERVEQEARAWIDYDPGLPNPRVFLRDSLDRQGKSSEANEQDRILRELVRRAKAGGAN